MGPTRGEKPQLHPADVTTRRQPVYLEGLPSLDRVGFDRFVGLFGAKYPGEPGGGRLFFSVRLFAVLPKPSI